MEIKKTKIKDILLNRMENTKTLTKTSPDNVRFKINFIFIGLQTKANIGF
jgi:hypothetical protein